MQIFYFFHSRLIIEPNFEKNINNGSIEILIENDLSYSSSILPIVLDIKNIDIFHSEIFYSDKMIPFTSEYGENRDTYILTINPSFANTYYNKHISLRVHMIFKSQLTSTLQGFYKTKYYDAIEGQSELASTQFSPIDARRAFPCFDRPDMKAQFQISVVRSNNMKMTLSNNGKVRER